MADVQPKSDTPIVTLRTVLGSGSLESARVMQESAASIDPVERAALINRYNNILEKLQTETDKAGENEIMDADTERELHGVAWKRLAADAVSPSCLVLDGPNPLVKGEEEKFGPHGYLTLNFDGTQLTECVHLPDGTEVFRGEVA